MDSESSEGDSHSENEAEPKATEEVNDSERVGKNKTFMSVIH